MQTVILKRIPPDVQTQYEIGAQVEAILSVEKGVPTLSFQDGEGAMQEVRVIGFFVCPMVLVRVPLFGH